MRRTTAIGASRLRACWLLPLALLALGAGAPRDLLVVSLDTVRRDHLGAYGYPRDTSPAIDELARRAVVFDNAYTQDVNTNPSHASMFTGVYPHVHGSLFNGVRLAVDQVTLAEILSGAGYETAAFVSGAPMSDEASGLARGFRPYDDELDGNRRDADATVARALAWLAKRSDDRPRFLFVHLYDAHGPYRPGVHAERFRSDSELRLALERIPKYQRAGLPEEEVPRRLGHYVDRYDGAIRSMDDAVAKLLGPLDLSRTAVVILSDHGETLGERYWKLDHGAQLFDEQIRIPWILFAPGLEPRRVGAAVETVDLLPTLLELLGVALPATRPVQGTSLLPLLASETASAWPESRRFVYATGRAVSNRHSDRGYALERSRRIEAVRGERFKLIRYPAYRGEPYLELYDLRDDPGETEDVAKSYPDTRDAIVGLLDRWLEGAEPSPPPDDLDPELQKRLESLGYVGD